jgi:hypothetical protein
LGVKYDFGVCRDCGLKTKVNHKEWMRAAIPRCRACGGSLEESNAAGDEHLDFSLVAKEQREQLKRKMGIS